jgi:hypothetical protein
MKYYRRYLLLSFLHLRMVAALRPWQQELGKGSAFGGEERTKVGNVSVETIERRQDASQLSTCGYYNGDPTKPRTAGPGDDCRFDTLHALWGFCPTTVIAATDCGLAGNCVDSYDCSNGCGMFGTPTITTFTW